MLHRVPLLFRSRTLSSRIYYHTAAKMGRQRLGVYIYPIHRGGKLTARPFLLRSKPRIVVSIF
jgi:hypothetical protein